MYKVIDSKRITTSIRKAWAPFIGIVLVDVSYSEKKSVKWYQGIVTLDANNTEEEDAQNIARFWQKIPPEVTKARFNPPETREVQ